jgi:hypothetical protein
MKDHINPVLGWGWSVGTLVANTVWALPQFTLGSAAFVGLALVVHVAKPPTPTPVVD